MKLNDLLVVCVVTATISLGLYSRITDATARGSLGYDQDQCVLKIGPDFFYFSGYQPGSGRKKFCEDAPSVGDTTFVFDFGQDELRGMKTDFRILREGEETADGAAADGPTIAYLAPQVYPSGTFSFAHRFDKAGNYVGVVTVEDSSGQHWEARFPFSVGGAPMRKLPFVLLGLAGALAVGLFIAGRNNKKA
jgi:hypothetical protein